jgi:hypothetical protein
MTLGRDRAPGVGLAVDEDFELGAGAGSSSLRIRSVVYPRVGRQRHEFEFVKGSAETAVKINLHRFSPAVSPNGNDPFDCGVDADWLDENAITDLHTSLHATSSLERWSPGSLI